ncbi:MAG: agmatine deiminase family protein [Saprospiraceae bacterium]
MTKKYRLPAEWEPQSRVQLTFPHADSDWAPYLEQVIPCFVEIIEVISRFQKVLIVCDDVARVRRLLKGIPEEQLLLVEIPSNDTWARDHAGITVLDANDQPMIWDFVFNGWGLKFPADQDNQITSRLQKRGVFGACPVTPGGIVLEGGGIESDGQDTLLTTTACMLSPNRNPHLDRSAIEQILRDRFGMPRILWLEHGHLAGDDTDSHIDTLARFCDPETIAYVQCTDPDDEHYEDLAAMELELQAWRTSEGKPYKLIPLPWPESCLADDGHRLPATYANFLIINGAVLVPVYAVRQDEDALRILKKCFPDREIIGINCSALIEQHGSLHCITMQYPMTLEIS